ncbi:MAG TPA: dihydrolipoyllysine-residue succinyltransferase, partial [Verrucomicrobiae bacterium]|nr:dihydrolipoyllysine-residue succinyltransferase [Verrucomicrobiae bacterium]
MPIELKVPEAGESVTEIEIGSWLKQVGDAVKKDESLVTLESDKATMDLSAPVAGKLTQILKQKGQIAKVGEVIGYLDKDGAPASTPTPPAAEKPASDAKTETKAKPPAKKSEPVAEQNAAKPKIVSPEPAKSEAAPESSISVVRRKDASSSQPSDRQEEVVPMSRMRRTVAARLVDAQHQAALLTTFNEIDMSAVIALRKECGEAFQKKYNVKLGFMSFFVKACVDALKLYPVLNAEVRESNIVYHNYFDIGIAIGGGKGLVVPVLRNVERLSFAEIESGISEYAKSAKENTLKVDDLQGGTFTITNGGIYGSMLSTPIVNPPQSGILGLHAIQDRPVARDGNVVIRPMMFAALT